MSVTSNVTQFASKTLQGLGGVVNKTPMLGQMHRWTVDRATNSEVARKVLVRVIYFAMAMILLGVISTVGLIYVGKVTAVVGTLLGGIFTLFSGILAIALPAFVNALIASQAASDAANTPTPPPPTP